MSEVDERRTRILADIARECGKQQQVLAGLHTDMVAIRNGAPATNLDIIPLLEGVFGKIDQLRRTQRTICSHYESLTGRRALPPQVRPPSPVFRF